MCGILGFFGFENIRDRNVVFSHRMLSHRGLDAFGFYDGNDLKTYTERRAYEEEIGLRSKNADNLLLHNLHAIIGFVPQPLKGRGTLIFNGELYNWKALKEKHNIEARNDSDVLFYLLEKLEKLEHVENVLEELKGVFAFAYWRGDQVVLCRDFVGVKPLSFGFKDGCFYFASEGKALDAIHLEHEPLLPEKILFYDIEKKEISKKDRKPLEDEPLFEKIHADLKSEVKRLLIAAVQLRVEGMDNFGILFSGGIDSTIIAKICKDLGKNFTCYTAGYKETDMDTPRDISWSERIAKELGFNLKEKIVGDDELENIFKEVIEIIEDDNVTKVGVASPFHIAATMAQEDGMKMMLSGLGAEEIFAGYNRHYQAYAEGGAKEVERECRRGLEDVWQRDLFRDDTMLMKHNIELRIPLLDLDLIRYALRIPAKYKINDAHRKIIIREVAMDLGIPEDIAYRKKLGAQYGSNFGKGIAKMARRAGFEYKKDYLKSLNKSVNFK